MGTNDRQPSLEGMEEPRIQELSDAALSYVNARDDRMEKSRAEKRAYERLARLMGEYDLDEYHDRETGVYIARDEIPVKFKVKLEVGSAPPPAYEPEKPIGEGVMAALPEPQPAAEADQAMGEGHEGDEGEDEAGQDALQEESQA